MDIDSTNFISQLMEYISPGNGLNYMLQNKNSKHSKRLEFSNIYHENLFPLWIDAGGNLFRNKDQDGYDKSSDTHFTVWMNRLLFQVTGKHLTVTTIRKMCVTMSRSNQWTEEEKQSLAFGMLHNAETAERTYNKISTTEKAKLACMRISRDSVSSNK